MNIHEISVELCKREKGRVQVDIAQVKEILARLADLIGENPEVEARFMKYVKQREFKARKKKMIKEKYK